MKKLNALFACMTLGFTLFSLVSCGNSNNENELRVGLECGYAPFNWTDPKSNSTNVAISGGVISSGYCDGYDITVAKFIAQDLGLKLVVKKIAWEGLINSLNENQIDVIIAGMSPTEERAKVINFTNDYYNSEQVVIVKKDSALASATTLNDFSGKTLVAQLGTLQDGLITAAGELGIIHGTAYDTYPDAFAALKGNPDIHGVVAEYPVALSAVASNSEFSIVRFAEGNGFDVNPEDVLVSIGVRKADTDLLNKINASLAKISKDTRDEWMLEAIARQPSSN